MIIKYLTMLLSLLTNPQHAMQMPKSAVASNNPVASSSQANQETLMKQLHEAAARLDVKRIEELLEKKGFVTEAESRAIKATASRTANSGIINKLYGGDHIGLIHEKTAYSSRILTVIAGGGAALMLGQILNAKYVYGIPLSQLSLSERIPFLLGVAIFVPSAAAAVGSWLIHWYSGYVSDKYCAIDDALSNKLRYSYPHIRVTDKTA